jgi:hypothetical protein
MAMKYLPGFLRTRYMVEFEQAAVHNSLALFGTNPTIEEFAIGLGLMARRHG